jgi:hypothetical protein
MLQNSIAKMIIEIKDSMEKKEQKKLLLEFEKESVAEVMKKYES